MIYATNSDSDNLPVRGYIVGGTKHLWAYNDCSAPEFEIDNYDLMFESPGNNASIGFLSRIELDVKSCKNEDIRETKFIGNIGEGIGREDTGDALIESSNY